MTEQAFYPGPRFTTLALHAGFPIDAAGRGPDRHRALPLDLVDTDERRGCAVLEDRIAALEGGTAAVAVRSGRAASLLVLQALLDRDDAVMASADLFGGDNAWITRAAEEFGWDLRWVKPADPDAMEDVWTPQTRAIIVESMTLAGEVIDLGAVAAVAERAGVPLIVDNTIASPYLINPLDHGAHAVLHAGGNVLAGQPAAQAGFVVDGGSFDWLVDSKLSRPSDTPDGRPLADQFGNFALAASLRGCSLRDLAAAPTAYEAAMMAAGLETLALRVQRQSDTALAVAQHMSEHAALRRVDYAGLHNHARHAVAQRICPRGAGGIVTLRLRTLSDAARVAAALQLFAPGRRPGDARSAIVEVPNSAAGSISLSMGLEDAEDLIVDLDQALSATRD